MADTQQDEDQLGKDLAAAFAADEAEHEVTPAADKELSKPAETTPPAPDPAKKEESDENKPVVQTEGDKENKPGEAPADPAKTEEDGTKTPEEAKTPSAPEEPVTPQPLTREDLTDVIKQMRDDERVSSQDLKQATQEVIDAYYPEGLSDVLIDKNTQKELRTPQDVVAAAQAVGDEISMEEAANWLLNEQFRVKGEVEKIRAQAEQIAETTTVFKKNSMAALQKYEPLFTAYPQLQAKVFDKMMKQVNADEKHGVILSAPDPLEFYDDYLEPYQMAYEQSTNKPATNPVDPVTPPPATPNQDDRLDELGDGGANTEVNDPNNFAQQVEKELALGP